MILAQSQLFVILCLAWHFTRISTDVRFLWLFCDLFEVLKHEKVWRSTLGAHSTGIHLSSPVTSHRRSWFMWFVGDPKLSLFQTLSVGIVDIGMLTSVRLQQTPSLLWQVLQMTKDASHKPPATEQANAFIPVSL